MNVLLWILQILLALHTIVGAVWKTANSAEQTMPSLKAIPDGVWLGMGAVEVLIGLCLILPAFYKPLAKLVPIAAVCIVGEMLLFCGLHFGYGDGSYGPMVYWLIVAGLSALLAYGRFSHGAIQKN
jgi:hypothetical protein